MVKIISIEALANHQHTSAYDQYAVVIEINGIAHHLEYTYELQEEDGLRFEGVTWKPEDSILDDHKAVDALVVMRISNTVMQYHKTRDVQLPKIIVQ